jgi:death-on-curing protein
VNYHVFIDGNKRTGITACARFLYQNGHNLSATNKEVERFVLSVAAEKIEMPIIVAWLKKHTKKNRVASPRVKRKKR